MPFTACSDALRIETSISNGAFVNDRDYEIRFLKADGATALVFVTSCVGDGHARETALRMMRPDYASFEVWRGQTCVAKGP